MNCECFYILKDGSIEKAREFCKKICDLAEAKNEEVYPVYISKVIKDFYATSDYDNFNPSFKVKTGSWLVFVQGKDYCMNRLKPRGGKRGFPDTCVHDNFWYDMYDFIEDIEEVI